MPHQSSLTDASVKHSCSGGEGDGGGGGGGEGGSGADALEVHDALVHTGLLS